DDRAGVERRRRRSAHPDDAGKRSDGGQKPDSDPCGTHEPRLRIETCRVGHGMSRIRVSSRAEQAPSDVLPTVRGPARCESSTWQTSTWTACSAPPTTGRTHLLALHAALTGERWAEEGRHRSVARGQLAATNVARVLLGHFHDGYDDGLLCYPGSPEPLGWGERHGDHGASIVTVSGGAVTARHVPLATRRYVDRTLS